ncbi:MAG: hypothetical protein ACRC2V_26250, partial [Xenococcaceae cyanobacterium]
MTYLIDKFKFERESCHEKKFLGTETVPKTSGDAPCCQSSPSCYGKENPCIALPPGVRIERDEDEDFGDLYKVFKNQNLLGTY